MGVSFTHFPKTGSHPLQSISAVPSAAASSITVGNGIEYFTDEERDAVLLAQLPPSRGNPESPLTIFSQDAKNGTWSTSYLSQRVLGSTDHHRVHDCPGHRPSIFGAVSDTGGRRLAFVLTLSVYTASNLALAFTSNYPMLMVLRGLQAAGSAATISISAGVISDMADPNERGGFMGTNAGIRMTGQAIGPIIGGAFNSAWGFRSIFWLLFSMSISVLLGLLVFLPETQRTVAGNGSIPLSGFKKPLAYWIQPPKEWAIASKQELQPSKAPPSLKEIFAPLGYIFQKDIAALLSWGAIVYTAWSMVTSSTTTALLRGYPFLTQWQIGLCFLPNGLGCVLGSLSTGRLLDRSFKSVEEQYKKERRVSTVNIKKDREFPFERARLPMVPYFSIAFVISMALYGPSFELNDIHRFQSSNLAAPLILQFFIAFTSTAIFNVNSTMLIDCFPDRSASATALNNLCRCLLGAAGVSAIQPMIDALKLRNSFLILAGVVIVFSPLIWIEWRWGQSWRQERERKKLAIST
uniref:Major facilitator superfamily (MFS) profile domain-containing protein n=1 Tax=Bionectria ochroleuca TaxID=29856 RepID=A0A8H7K3H4_BIOOC